MEDIASLWSYQESTEELKQKLLYTTRELESAKMEANEEIRKSREYSNQLLQLLKITCQERDEAKEQLQKLLNNFMIQLQPETPLIKPAKTISSMTESDSFSDTHNYSSPANSFFDSVSSPELSTINMADSSNLAFVNQPFVQDYGATAVNSNPDHACLVIEKIVEGKALPRKGELLQSVLAAGPLLQTLLVAGPLPRWRNPPPPLHSMKIPPVSGNGYVEMSCGSSQMLETTTTKTTTSVLDFGSGDSGRCLRGGKLIPAGDDANYVPVGKRQRFQ